MTPINDNKSIYSCCTLLKCCNLLSIQLIFYPFDHNKKCTRRSLDQPSIDSKKKKTLKRRCIIQFGLVQRFWCGGFWRAPHKWKRGKKHENVQSENAMGVRNCWQFTNLLGNCNSQQLFWDSESGINTNFPIWQFDSV